MIEVLITSSLLITAIALLRALLKDRVSARLIYALWLVAALRLMLPFSLFDSPVSVMNAPMPEIEVPSVIYTDIFEQEPVTGNEFVPVENRAPDAEAPSQVAAEPDAGSIAQAEPATPSVQQPKAEVDVESVLRLAWFVGACVMAAGIMIANGAMYFRLRGERRRIEGVSSPLRVYMAYGLTSPCIFGLIRPSIYLTPAALESDERLDMVLLHEETHYRRGDHLWALLRCVLLCVYWFDPFVWLAVYLSRCDCELACDESCVKRLGSERRLDYGRALIELIDRRSRSGLLRTATTMSGGKRAVRERVKRIARAPKTRAAALVLILVLVGLVSACTFTGAEQPSPPIDADAPLTNATAYARLADGTLYEVTDTHSFEYDPDTGMTTLSYADGQTVELTLPADLTSPYVFMSDTVAAASYVNADGELHVMLSRDRGVNWTEQTVTTGLKPDAVTFIGFSNANDGWLFWEQLYESNMEQAIDGSGNVIEYESHRYDSQSFITNDGGTSWVNQPINRFNGHVTGLAVVNGTAYVGVTDSGSSGYTYYTNKGESYDGLYPQRPSYLTDDTTGLEFTSTLAPVAGTDSVSLPLLMPDNSVVTREAEIVQGGLFVPEPFTGSDDILNLPYGVNIAISTDELLGQLWGPMDFRETDHGGTELVFFTDDSRPDNYECRVVRLSDDLTWIRPENVSEESLFTDGVIAQTPPYTAYTFNVTFDENGHSDTVIIIASNSIDEPDLVYRIDMVDGKLTATQVGLGVDVESATAAATPEGQLILDYADSATAAVYTSVQTVDAANGAGAEEFVLCARHDTQNLYIVALDYSSGAAWPEEGEKIARIGTLLAGQCVTVSTASDGGFGILYTDDESKVCRYYFSVGGTGAIEIYSLSRNYETDYNSSPDTDTGFGVSVKWLNAEHLSSYGEDVRTHVSGFPPQTEYLTQVALMTDETVTNVRIFGIDYADESHMTPLEGELVYSAETFTPEELIVFDNLDVGSMTQTRGIAFTDADGVEHRYRVSVNYESGGVGLLEF